MIMAIIEFCFEQHVPSLFCMGITCSPSIVSVGWGYPAAFQPCDVESHTINFKGGKRDLNLGVYKNRVSNSMFIFIFRLG